MSSQRQQNSAAIEVVGLSKRYRLGGPPKLSRLRQWLSRPVERETDYIWSLRDVGFAVHEGEVLGIVGRNGAGKSTLLKVLSRITEPTTGRVVMRGRVSSLLEVGTGFHPDLTGRENIFLNGSILGMSRNEIQRQFDAIVEFADIARFLDTPVKRYSSGMYVRLAFAVAAHLEPEILIIDEVLAVGDVAFQRKCLGAMRNIAGSGRTVLFVSHNMAAINHFCTRALRLREGRLVHDGKPADVTSGYIADNYSNERARRWPFDPSKRMQIRALEIRDDNAENVLYRTEPIEIRLTYEVSQPVSGADPELTIESSDGGVVLQTRELDCAEQGSVRREPGIYTTCVTLPPRLLNVGSYLVRASIAWGAPHEHLDSRDGLLFELHDPEGEMTTRSGARRRLGVLCLNLPWAPPTRVSEASVDGDAQLQTVASDL